MTYEDPPWLGIILITALFPWGFIPFVSKHRALRVDGQVRVLYEKGGHCFGTTKLGAMSLSDRSINKD